MKGLVRICRLIVGVVFVFSGFVKLLSPVGTSLILKEYFEAFHLGFMAPAALGFAIALALTEFLTGVALLLRLRIRLFAWIALILICLFTPITLYLAVFNPIQDCGCFGEVIHLTNWQTFFKNLILLPCVIVIFVGRKAISQFRYPVLEWIFVALFAAMAVWMLIRTLCVAPIQESTAYRVSKEITAAPAAEAVEEYETTFIYEKDGCREPYTLDNLPDSTWTFVEAVTTGAGGAGINASDADFRLEDYAGGDITDAVLSKRQLLVMSIYHPDRFLRRKGIEPIVEMAAKAREQGMEFLVASGAPIEGLPEDIEAATGDVKLLMTFNRSNGGATYLNDGMIVRKWAFTAANQDNVNFNAENDAEMELLKTLNRQRVAIELLIFIFIVLCLAKFAVFFKKRE